MIEFKRVIKSALKSIAVSTSNRDSTSPTEPVVETPPLYPCPPSLGAYFTAVKLRSKTLLGDSRMGKNATEEVNGRKRSKDHALDVSDEVFPGVFKAHVLSLDERDLQLVQSTAFQHLLKTLLVIPMTSQGVKEEGRKKYGTEEAIKSALRGEISFEEAMTGIKRTLILSPRTSIASMTNCGIFGAPLNSLDSKIVNPDCKLPRLIVHLMQLIYEREGTPQISSESRATSRWYR